MFMQNFWTFTNFNNTNTRLNDMIKDKNTSIEQFFEEENLVSDVRQVHQKFADYLFLHPKKLKTLINYCLLVDEQKEKLEQLQKKRQEQIEDSQQESNLQGESSDEINDQKKNLVEKFPFVASEIFASSLPQFSEYLFGKYMPEPEDLEDIGNGPEQPGGDQDDHHDDIYESIYVDEDENNGEKKKSEDLQKSEEKTGEEEEEQQQQLEETTDEEKKEENNKIKKEEENENDDDKKVEKKDDSQKKEGDNDVNEEEEEEEEEINPKDLLLHILSFLDRNPDEPYYDTCAGYFAKIITILISKEGSFFQYFDNPDNTPLLLNFTKRLHNRSISELVLKLIVHEGTDKNGSTGGGNQSDSYPSDKLEDEDNNLSEEENNNNKNSGNNDKFLHLRVMLLGELFKNFRSSNDEGIIENIVYILNEVIQVVGNTERNFNGFFDSLQKMLYSKENIEILFNKAFNNLDNSQLIQSTVFLLGQIFSIFSSTSNNSNNNYNYNNFMNRNNNNSGNNSMDEDQVVLQEDGLNENFPFAFYSSQIPRFLKYIKVEQHLESEIPEQVLLVNQMKIKLVKFGLGRLQVLDFLSLIIKTKNIDIQNAVQQSQFFEIIFEIFRTYEWNSIIHSSFDKIVTAVFDGSDELIRNFFDQTHILTFIIDQHDQKSSINTRLKINKGFTGFLNKFSSLFCKKEKENSIITEYLQNCEGWEDYATTSLNSILECEQQHNWGSLYNEEHKDEIDLQQQNDQQYGTGLYGFQNQQQQSAEEKNAVDNVFKGSCIQSLNPSYHNRQKSMFDDSSDEEDADQELLDVGEQQQQKESVEIKFEKDEYDQKISYNSNFSQAQFFQTKQINNRFKIDDLFAELEI